MRTDIKKSDEYKTPDEAILPLLEFIRKKFPKGSTVWEPCGENSNITKIFRSYEYNVIETHINKGFDFLKDNMDKDFDLIVTNPPYSKKDEWLERCYEHGKPFALLMPTYALNGKKRVSLYKKYGIELIVFDKRIQFDRKRNGAWFPVCWFCWKILDRNKMEFVILDKYLK